MTEDSLVELFYKHLRKVGLPTDLTITLQGYSSTYNGRYDTVNQRIYLYHLEQDGTLRDISELCDIIRHETIHHFQWVHDPNFKRVKGVMHNKEFYRLEKLYKIKSKGRLL